jgi:ATP-dependent Clp protease ATP-binding subunit ClpC
MFDFIIWHYSKGLERFWEVCKNFLEFFWKHFSVRHLLGTLFSPWKRDVSRSMQRGLHPVIWITNLIENIMTRIIGSIVRSGVIIFALFLELFTLIACLALMIFWIFSPFLLLFVLVAIYFYFSDGLGFGFFLSSLLFLIGVILSFFSFRSFRFTKRSYFSMSLSELSQEKWFGRVWNRIGVSPEEVDSGILESGEALTGYLSDLNLTKEEFMEIVDWEMRNQIQKEIKGKFWLRENLFSKSPIGRYWAFAYTVKLDRCSSDLSEGDYSEYRHSRLFGRDRDLQEMKLLLTRSSQNNVILVGEEGVGRDTIVHTLSREIREMKAGEDFNDKRLLDVNIKEIISNAGERNEVENSLREIFYEAAYAGNIILFIKDIHQYLKKDSQSEGDNIAEILSQFLAYPTFQIIGTTTPSEFHENVEKSESVMKYCDKIIIDEMSKEDTVRVLLTKLKTVEKNEVIFTYQGIQELIKLCERYISDSPFPEKALDMMEEVILFWSNNGYSPKINEEVVAQAFSNKIKVPLGEMTESESDKLLNLENILHQRVIGQDFAIKQIAETMRRARVGMANDKKPLGSFLFIGPTGVGKTESAKALAESYFGDENRMIRLDMSEYQTQGSIDHLIGSSALGQEGQLTSKVKESPCSILLLDEIEKANSDILNLFLQVLDEGNLTDAFGKKINFKNLIIIATSNAGADIIRDCIREGIPVDSIKEKVVDFVIKQGIFRPEFLNRFEGVIFFHPLDMEAVRKITQLMLENYAKNLKEKENITIQFNPEIVDVVSEKSYDPTFGARNINRFIQDKIEDKIVKKIISGSLKKGGSVVFGKEDME